VLFFFGALHDLGKLDLRFQLKAPAAIAAAWRPTGEPARQVLWLLFAVGATDIAPCLPV
jgi:hypothetical protein